MSIKSFSRGALAISGLALVGCAHAQTTTVSAPAAESEPAFEMPPGLHWLRTSAEYQALVRQIYRQATDQLPLLVRDLEAGTWAVALDADETVLDNSLYQVERERLGLGYTRESWTEWCQRREAGALPAVAGFLATVHDLGGKIAIVTNRRADVQDDTEANFVSLGLPFDVILTRPMDASGKKEARWEQVRRGATDADLPPLTVVMWLGDNIGDFPDLDQTCAQQGRTTSRNSAAAISSCPIPSMAPGRAILRSSLTEMVFDP